MNTRGQHTGGRRSRKFIKVPEDEWMRVKRFIETFSVNQNGKLDFDGHRAHLNIWNQNSDHPFKIYTTKTIEEDEEIETIGVQMGLIFNNNGASIGNMIQNIQVQVGDSGWVIDKSQHPDVVQYDLSLIIYKNYYVSIAAGGSIGRPDFEPFILAHEVVDGDSSKYGIASTAGGSAWDGGALTADEQTVIDKWKLLSDETNDPGSMANWQSIPIGSVIVGRKSEGSVEIYQSLRQDVKFECSNEFVTAMNVEKYGDSTDDEETEYSENLKPYAPWKISAYGPHRLLMRFNNSADVLGLGKNVDRVLIEMNLAKALEDSGIHDEDVLDIKFREFDICVDGEEKKMMVLASQPYDPAEE
jgi:hypothetical protein